MMVLGLSSTPDRWLVRVRGFAQVMVEDREGRRVGPSRDPEYPNLVENQIPGASYTPGEIFSSVFLDQPGVYTFTVIPRAPTSVHLSLTLFNAASNLHTFFFQGVPLAEQSQARLLYDTRDQSTTPILALDRDGNGQIEPIQPTTLSSQAFDDVVPPSTRIDFDDNNVVTASASDNPGGAGILCTYYTTDGTSRSVYSEPFTVPSDAKIVMAYSEDRVGNLEYPGAARPVLGLSEPRVVLESGASRTVEVMNLDPISVTDQLQWAASTDVDWLSIEPGAGMTPSPMQLSVLFSSPERGRLREATVVVRSLTPGTIFPERLLAVAVVDE